MTQLSLLVFFFFKFKDLPEPLNWLLASVIGLFFPLATGGANIYKTERHGEVSRSHHTIFFYLWFLVLQRAVMMNYGSGDTRRLHWQLLSCYLWSSEKLESLYMGLWMFTTYHHLEFWEKCLCALSVKTDKKKKNLHNIVSATTARQSEKSDSFAGKLVCSFKIILLYISPLNANYVWDFTNYFSIIFITLAHIVKD